MTSRTPTTPPTRPRLPTWSELDDRAGRALLEGLRELREEERKREEWRRLAEEEGLYMLAMKAKQVAELDRRRPRLVYDRDRIAPRQV